ncbi:LysR family transcriptional regulator [Gloeocapsopsis crepidinum LEGE 06123]|uniref:LysR family transcriptional regulator n=1 Tax=Gloeocapsopsis crepidinum LEGE 06123 TaxID=588587 RepID=A0ABR9UVJ8_9CHRO|nr:LysR substrate-binding domain-containing protein [Gloeocapsopsis crepidinum]MBE9192331.1 LysR family transcriptional regulator [Gloeocapsopsis crepidinum LEGE 06123]
MELRHLRYFITVAEELNFSRAAERLHIAQPPLSQQIRDLEIELGVKLFERTKRRVELTTPGKVFLEKSRLALQQVEQAVIAVQKASRGEIGRLVIGFNSSATYSILPKILRVFREQCPDVELDLQELTTRQQCDRLHHNQIDVGILYLPIESETLSTMTILQESLILALAATHPLAALPEVSIKALTQEPFIMPPHHLGGGLYNQILRFFQQTNFIPNVLQEATQLQTTISLVAGSIGIALVPASLQNLQRSGVVYKTLQEPTPEIEIALAWRKQDSSPVLQNFINTVSLIHKSYL